MKDLRQAAQQAFEALEVELEGYDGPVPHIDTAITALRAALAEHDRLAGIEAIEKDAGIHVSQQAEPEQEPIQTDEEDTMSKKCKAYSKSKLGLSPPDNRKSFYAGWDAALRSALTEPEQKPVAWRVQRSDGQYELYFLKAAAERAAECYIKRPPVEPLYTAPTPRKPLTEDEIAEASAGVLGLPHEIKVELARAIERAHGIGERT